MADRVATGVPPGEPLARRLRRMADEVVLSEPGPPLATSSVGRAGGHLRRETMSTATADVTIYTTPT